MKLLWVFDYDAVIALSPLGGALWAFGGSGEKPLRRFLLPAILALSSISLGVVWWRWLPASLFLSGATTLPYGDKTEEKLDKMGVKWLYWWFVYAVGASYGLSLISLFIGQETWVLGVCAPFITGSTFALGMSLSKSSNKIIAWICQWKVIEVAVGMVVSGLWAYAIYPRP